MKSVYGTARNADGDFVAVKLTKKSEQWEAVGVTTWPVRGYGAELHSLGKSVYLAVKGAWQPTAYTDEQIDLVAVPGAGGFSASVFRAERDIDMEVFGCTIAGVVPIDSYLTTIPLHFAENVAESFVCVHVEDETVHIGITIDRTPAAVFHVGPGTDERMLEGHLGRLERYWTRLDTGIPFPEKVYAIGSARAVSPDWTKVNPGKEFENRFALGALGAALCHLYSSVPFFSGAEHSPAIGAVRTALTRVAAAVIILGITAVGIPLGIHTYNQMRINSFENEYRQVVSGNAEIRADIRKTESLAQTVLQLHDDFSRRTTWGRFLDDIGRIRPDKLYLTRLGSEAIEDRPPRNKKNHRVRTIDRGLSKPQMQKDSTANPDNSNREVRIAMVGWAHKEELITEFMGSLQKMGIVHDIQLASLERDKKNRAITRFRILCRLTLIENI